MPFLAAAAIVAAAAVYRWRDALRAYVLGQAQFDGAWVDVRRASAAGLDLQTEAGAVHVQAARVGAGGEVERGRVVATARTMFRFRVDVGPADKWRVEEVVANVTLPAAPKDPNGPRLVPRIASKKRLRFGRVGARAVVFDCYGMPRALRDGRGVFQVDGAQTARGRAAVRSMLARMRADFDAFRSRPEVLTVRYLRATWGPEVA